MRFLIFLSIFFPMTTFAQSLVPTATTQACPECLPIEKCSTCAREMGLSESYRDDSNHTLMVGYQYASTWVIGKKTASYTYVAGRTWSFELEYATSERTAEIGDFELGKIQEDRYTLFTKYYLTNSFHFSFGPYMYQYKINTAGSLTNVLNQDFQEKWDITGLGIAFAFGNRWQTNWGLTWGFDWVRMNYPLVTTWLNKDTGELTTATREDTDRTFDLIRKIPTFAFFTVNIGYTF